MMLVEDTEQLIADAMARVHAARDFNEYRSAMWAVAELAWMLLRDDHDPFPVGARHDRLAEHLHAKHKDGTAEELVWSISTFECTLH